MNFDTFSKEEPLGISAFEATTWPYSPKRNSHYELVYILAGRGQHISAECQYPYQPGDLFLFRASDVHWFCSSQPTRFCVVRLSPGLLREAHATFAEIPPTFEQTCFQGPPELTADDRAYVGQQLAFCLREHAQPQAFGDSLLRASLLSVLLLLRRAHTRPTPILAPTATSPENLVSALVEYVRQHLKEPPRLSAAAIGERFHHTPRYVGQYFQRHLGRGLKRFVEESRVYAIQQELRFTDKTISQLALEYGFADESHLGKVFKSLTNQTPWRYRRAWEVPLPLVDLLA